MSNQNYSDLGWFSLKHLDKINSNSVITDELRRQWLDLETFELNPPEIDTYLTLADRTVLAASNSRRHPIDTSWLEIERSLTNLDPSDDWAPAYPVVLRAYPYRKLASAPDTPACDRIADILLHRDNIIQNPILLAQIIVAIASINPRYVETCIRELKRRPFPLDIADTGIKIIKMQGANHGRQRILNLNTLTTPASQVLRDEANSRARRSVYVGG